VTTRILDLRLCGFGAPASPARAEVAELAGADRVKRAAVVFGAFVAVAIVALPIPIVHLMLVPGALLLALVLGGLRLRENAIFRDVSGKCPFCGTEQHFRCSGGFAFPRMFTAPAVGGS
jgi:1,6-anhydro-N-acetylmuramate kinase